MSKPSPLREEFLGLLGEGGDVKYLVLSEGGRARFALPTVNARVLRAAMSAYSPTTMRALIAWKTAGTLARAGLGSWLPGRHARLSPRLAPFLSRIVDRTELYVSVASSFHGDRCVLGLIDAHGRHLGFAKVAPTQNGAAVDRLRIEADRLRWLEGSFEGIRIPRVVHLGRFEEFEVLVVTPIAGRSRFDASQLTPRRIAAAVEIFGIRGSATTIGDHLEDALDDDDDLERLRVAAVAATERTADRTLPSGLAHGDFAPWNLLEGSDRLGVIDWEHARPDGLPFWDLWHFAVLSATLLGSTRMRRSILDAVRGEGRLAAAMGSFARASGLSSEVAPDVLLVYLIRQGALVREEARRGATDARRGIGPWIQLLEDSLAVRA